MLVFDTQERLAGAGRKGDEGVGGSVYRRGQVVRAPGYRSGKLGLAGKRRQGQVASNNGWRRV